MEHERYAQLLQQMTVLQLRRAQTDAASQLEAAEDHMSSIISIVQEHGFEITFDNSEKAIVTEKSQKGES